MRSSARFVVIVLMAITLSFGIARPGTTATGLVPAEVSVPPELASAFPRPRAVELQGDFQISLFSANLPGARLMAAAPDGSLLVSLLDKGAVMALPDPASARYATEAVPILEGLHGPHGLAFHRGFLYVAETHRVIRLPYRGRVPHDPRTIQVVIPNLPTGGHWTRTAIFGPDDKLYVSIGSSCNICRETHPWRAAVIQANPDGSGARVFARGLRNSVGLAFRPGTRELWGTDNGRDWMGDDLPPDKINIIRDGKDYGWPYCYGNRIPDTTASSLRGGIPIACRETEPPLVELQAHSAPLGLAFYQGDLLVASHGSWNRTVPTGYKIFRVRLRSGKPVGVEEFARGWLTPTGVWGRPVDLLAAGDGSVLVSDDKAGVIYRIAPRERGH